MAFGLINSALGLTLYYSQDISLSATAVLAGMGHAAFSHSFRKVSGNKFVEFVKRFQRQQDRQPRADLSHHQRWSRAPHSHVLACRDKLCCPVRLGLVDVGMANAAIQYFNFNTVRPRYFTLKLQRLQPGKPVVGGVAERFGEIISFKSEGISS